MMKYEMMVFENHYGDLPFPINFKPYLFNEIRHIESQKPFDKLITFALLNQTSKVFDARLQVIKNHNAAYSPFKATFGGIEFTESLPKLDLFTFFQKVLHHPEVKNINLTIRDKPSFYSPNIISWEAEKIIDINQHLVIDETPFFDKIRPSERRRIKKCKRANFVFEELLVPDFSLIHQFIKSNRDRKNRPMSMSIEALQKAFLTMPDDYKIFAVKDQQRIIALSLIVKLNEDLQYIFLPADDADYLTYSPSVMLFDGIYTYCQHNNFKSLDFGISSEEGVLNEGLFRFKKNLGCISSEKITYKKQSHQLK